uniref:C1 protein n=1 Tax=Tomato leaf curl Malaysia betasatellite TaxID=2049892 RepID=A0A5S9M2G7_9VIRU|nr:C1 protein [Tomato leaf curl Malaysia betasatellite]
MTITYNNKKGMQFIINVRLRADDSILVQVDLFSTKSAALSKKRFLIPYNHHGITPPFDFNSLEERIGTMLKELYNASTIGDFKQEDMIEMIDIILMAEAPVMAIDLGEDYHVFNGVIV